MSGTIRTYQRCPVCGGAFPSSKGDFPIVCPGGCQTQPDKFLIAIRHAGRPDRIYRDKAGRTIHSFQHAFQVLSEIRAAKGRGALDLTDYKQTAQAFGKFWQDFLKDYKPKSATRDKAEAVGRHFQVFNEINIKEITGLQIKEWWRDLQGRGFSPKYQNDILQWLRRAFLEALRLQVIERIPAFPRPLKTPSKTICWLDREEQLRALLALPEHDQPIYSFMMLTGCRVMEAAALHWEDIYKNRIVLGRTIDRRGQLQDRPKDGEARALPMTREIEALFTSIRRRPMVGIAGFVFLNQWGRQYSYEYLRST